MMQTPLYPAPNVVSTTLSDDEAVLLHLITKRYYTLNETGMRIWDLLVEGAAPDRITAALAEEYDIAPNEAAQYVEAFLTELQQEGLLQAD